MAIRYNLYVDESGTREPDRNPKDVAPGGRDYFAIGGVLVRQDDEAGVRQAHARFCSAWNFVHPLHSYDMRNKTKNFRHLEIGRAHV